MNRLFEKRLYTIGWVWSVDFTFKGIRMFADFYYPQGTYMKRERLEKDLHKLYPGAVLVSWRRTNQEPRGPLIVMQESHKYSNETKRR